MDSNDSSNKEDKKSLFRDLGKLKDEIISLRSGLNRENKEKEDWFGKKDEISKKIREKIALVMKNKEKRDILTKKVRELKVKRNSSSDDTNEKVSEFKKLNEEKKSIHSKSKIENPLRLKGQIDLIEVKLETEAMSFEAEKKLSKKLKALKKHLEESSVLIMTIEKIKKLNHEINSGRNKTDKVHYEVQKTAKESQELHESILKFSKEIDELKVKEVEAMKKSMEFKKKFNDVNTKLKEKLSDMGTIRDKINKHNLEEEEKRKLKESMLIKNKELEFEEKIKTGRKLTTDDFLVFQDGLGEKK